MTDKMMVQMVRGFVFTWEVLEDSGEKLSDGKAKMMVVEKVLPVRAEHFSDVQQHIESLGFKRIGDDLQWRMPKPGSTKKDLRAGAVVSNSIPILVPVVSESVPVSGELNAA